MFYSFNRRSPKPKVAGSIPVAPAILLIEVSNLAFSKRREQRQNGWAHR